MQQKQKKIGQLRTLLGQANNKIKALKQNLFDKVLNIIMTTRTSKYSKSKQTTKKVPNCIITIELKSMQSDEGLIMKQYEQRLIRIQKSLQDSQTVVAKYKRLHQESSRSYESVMTEITSIANLIMKTFVPYSSKENNEAVEELCAIEKCKDFDERMEKLQGEVPLLGQLVKGIKKLSYIYVDSLNKKRQLRLVYLKKQASLHKQLEDQQAKHATSNNEIERLNQQIKNIEEKYEKKIETIAKSKAKMSEEKVNLQFIKQLLIKVVLGPKQASLMAFEVLSKVLKFTPDQYKTTQKKIK